MARERLHRKLLFSYLLLIAGFAGATWWLTPHELAVVRGLVASSALAVCAAVLFTALAARDVGEALRRIARGLRGMAAGEPVRARELRAERRDRLDEIDDITTAIGDLSRQLEGERDLLRAEAARLRTVLDGMSEGVALLSGGRIAFANPAFARLLDVPDPVEGLTPLEAARRHDIAASVDAAGSGNAADARDIPVPSGRIVQLRTEPLSPGVAVVVLLDVTEARQLERMRREFVANASHELRTPVAAIQAVAETLSAAPNMAPADRARFERILHNHAARLSRLVKDLLDLSRAEAGSPRVEPVDLAGPLGNALALVREKAEGKRVTLEDNVARDLPPLAADATSVEQVLVNLLDNAVKYTPEGGRVIVRAALDGNGAAGTPRVRIEVEDTGIGIPAEHQARIFERFYRVDAARSRDLGGTGLGLAIVKHLVQAHGGEVNVRSRVGAGSTFCVSFPALRGENGEIRRTAAQAEE